MTVSKQPVYAIVAAAGRGSRLAQDINKQFIEVGDCPVVTRTVRTLAACSQIEGIVVVAAQDEIEMMRKCLSVVGTARIISITAGGATRQESVRLGLSVLKEAVAPSPDSPILVHDGARCFVSQVVIERVIEGIAKFTACGAAVPVKDTIKEVVPHAATLPGQLATDQIDGLTGHQVIRTLDRSRLWSMQTPQGATFSLLLDAYELADRQDWQATDDLSLLELAGHTVYLVDGDYRNIKITTQDDLLYGEWLAQQSD